METIEAYREKFNNYSRDQLFTLIAQLSERITQLELCLFSSKKERFSTEENSGMRGLFDEPESLIEAEPEAISEETEENDNEENSSEKNSKKRGKRKSLPINLPRKRIEIDLSDEEKFCHKHQKQLVKIGEEIVEKLEIIPAKSYVAEIATLKYKCSCCEQESQRCEIKSASRDQDLIPKSFASPSLLAYIISAKYDDALPLYRQEKIFARYGIELPRATMARWMIRVSEKCQPLINLIHEDLSASPILHCDETPLQVLKEENRRPEQKSYMWCLGRRSDEPLILFSYFDNRSNRAGTELLTDFKGKLVCDAYKVYSSLSKKMDFSMSACLAHARRKFWIAEKSAKKSGANTSAQPLLASQALTFIRRLYKIEKTLKNKNPDEILTIRQRQALPVLQEFHLWLQRQKTSVLPSAAIGKAVNYTLGIWDYLNPYCHDPMLPIDNNWLESHLRPFVIGRKNWLFACTPKGAQASANLYSLVESAKLNGLCPYSYLGLIFKELPNAQSLADYERLLPHKAARNFSIDPYKKPG